MRCISEAILIRGKQENWHANIKWLINLFYTFVMSWHAMKRFSFPAPVLQHLRRSFNKVSFHMSATVTEQKNIENYAALQSELLFPCTTDPLQCPTGQFPLFPPNHYKCSINFSGCLRTGSPWVTHASDEEQSDTFESRAGGSKSKAIRWERV